jgi:hypothetical protein
LPLDELVDQIRHLLTILASVSHRQDFLVNIHNDDTLIQRTRYGTLEAAVVDDAVRRFNKFSGKTRSHASMQKQWNQRDDNECHA